MANNFTKKDIIYALQKQTELPAVKLRTLVHGVFEAIFEAISQGQTVEIRNFGTFQCKVHKSRIGRDPSNPTATIRIPERAAVRFRPGKSLKDNLNKLDPSLVNQ